MNFLRKKLFILGLIILVVPFGSFAGIKDDYRRQEKQVKCNYENSQFYSLNSDSRYCTSGGFWKEFFKWNFIF